MQNIFYVTNYKKSGCRGSQSLMHLVPEISCIPYVQMTGKWLGGRNEQEIIKQRAKENNFKETAATNTKEKSKKVIKQS